MKTLKEFLIQKNACSRGFDFAKDLTLEQFLNTCDQGDWILWLFARMNPDCLRELTLAKAHCANTVRHLMKDERSIKAVDVAIAFGEGKVTRTELDDAADAAFAAYAAYAGAAASAAAAADAAAADAADAAFAAYAASACAVAYYAAAYTGEAARAAAAAAYATADAAFAAYATADAAAYAAYAGAAASGAGAAAAEKQNQKLTADICRKYLPLEIWNQNLI